MDPDLAGQKSTDPDPHPWFRLTSTLFEAGAFHRRHSVLFFMHSLSKRCGEEKYLGFKKIYVLGHRIVFSRHRREKGENRVKENKSTFWKD